MKILKVLSCFNIILIVFFLFLSTATKQLSVPIATCLEDKASDIFKTVLLESIYYHSLKNKYANAKNFADRKSLIFYLKFFKLNKAKKDFLYFGENWENIGGVRIYDKRRNLIWDFYFENTITSIKIFLFPESLRQSTISELAKRKKICGVFVFSENGQKELYCKNLFAPTGAIFEIWNYKTFKKYKLVSSYLTTQWPFSGFPDIGKFAIEFDWDKMSKSHNLSFPWKRFFLYRVLTFLVLILNFPERVLINLILIQVALMISLKFFTRTAKPIGKKK